MNNTIGSTLTDLAPPERPATLVTKLPVTLDCFPAADPKARPPERKTVLITSISDGSKVTDTYQMSEELEGGLLVFDDQLTGARFVIFEQKDKTTDMHQFYVVDSSIAASDPGSEPEFLGKGTLSTWRQVGPRQYEEKGSGGRSTWLPVGMTFQGPHLALRTAFDVLTSTSEHLEGTALMASAVPPGSDLPPALLERLDPTALMEAIDHSTLNQRARTAHPSSFVRCPVLSHDGKDARRFIMLFPTVNRPGQFTGIIVRPLKPRQS